MRCKMQNSSPTKDKDTITAAAEISGMDFSRSCENTELFIEAVKKGVQRGLTQFISCITMHEGDWIKACKWLSDFYHLTFNEGPNTLC